MPEYIEQNLQKEIKMVKKNIKRIKEKELMLRSIESFKVVNVYWTERIVSL